MMECENERMIEWIYSIIPSFTPSVINPKGELAQLARASALHAEGQRFESVILHDQLPVAGYRLSADNRKQTTDN